MAATTTAPGHGVERAIRGALLGVFADMFDIYLPVVVLAPAIAYFVAPGVSEDTTALVVGAVFAAGLSGRALGGLLSGRITGRGGRGKAALASVGGFGLVTVLIGCLPGRATWGAASVVLLVVLRFVAGVLVGRPPAVAASAAMPGAPPGRRGDVSARVMAGLPLALFALSGLTLLVLQIAPSGDPSSAYSVWGWRVPFLAAGLAALALAVRLARRSGASGASAESGAFAASGASRAAVARGRAGDRIGRFAQVLILMTGFWLTLNTVTAILPGALKDTVGLSDAHVALTMAVAALANAGGYPAVGWLVQRYGRRPFLVAWGISAAVLGTFVYATLLRFPPPSLATTVALAAATVVLVGPCWAMIAAYLGERFPDDAPPSAVGLAAILPSFYAVYQTLLGHVMDGTYAVLVLLVIGGLLITAGGAAGPETRDIELEPRRARDRAPRFTRRVVDEPSGPAAAVVVGRDERLA